MGEDSSKQVIGMDEVVQSLKEMISEIIGESAAEIVGITEKSSFLSDLGMNSIQIVALAEKARGKYGDRVNLTDWFSKRPIFLLVRMTVRDVAKLIVKGNPSS